MTVSVILHKHPQFTLAFAVIPLAYALSMFVGGKLYEQPMLYIVSAILHASGCLYECIRRDGEDGGRRSASAADMLGFTIAAFSLLVIYVAKRPMSHTDFENSVLYIVLGIALFTVALIKNIPAIVTPAPFFPHIEGISEAGLISAIKDHFKELGEALANDIPSIESGFMEKQIQLAVNNGNDNVTPFIIAVVAFVILPIVSKLLKNLYFIDAALSIIPLIIFTYMFSTARIPFLGEVLTVLSAAYAICRITVMVFGGKKTA